MIDASQKNHDSHASDKKKSFLDIKIVEKINIKF